MECVYCKTVIDQAAANCYRCGGPVEPKQEERKRGEPFYFHGFMVWPERNFNYDKTTYHIYEGSVLVGSFDITREAFMAWDDMYPGTTHEPMIDKLLRLAIGETEVERYEEASISGRKFLFTVTREDAPEYAEAKHFIRELMDANHANIPLS